MPKLNLANEAVQNYFTEVGLYWIREFGIDGWRLDVADEMPTKFLEHFAATVKEKYPMLFSSVKHGGMQIGL